MAQRAIPSLLNNTGHTLYYDSDTMKMRSTADDAPVALPAQDEPTLFDRAADTLSGIKDSLNQMYEAYAEMNADRSAKMFEASKQLVNDPSSIFAAPAELQDKVVKTVEKEESKPDWDTLIRSNPQTAILLNDRGVMPIAHDDVDALSAIEDIGNAVKNSYEYAQKNRELGEIGAKMQEANQTLESISDEDRQRIKALQARMRELSKEMPESILSPSGLASGIASFAPQAVAAIKGAAVGASTGAVLGSVVPGVGSIVGAAAGAGASFGMGYDYGRQQQGLSYLQSLAEGADRKSASRGSAVAGLVNGLLAVPMAGAAVRAPLIRGSESLLKRIAADVLEQSAVGAGMAATDILANKIAHGKATSWNLSDISNVVETGAEQVPVALAFGAPGIGIGMMRAWGKQVDRSKTLQRNPDIVANHIRNIVKDTPAEKIKFDATTLVNTLNEMEDTEAQKVAARLKLNMNELPTDVSTGGEVSVNTSDFLILPEKIRERLIEQARIDGDPSVLDMQDMESMADTTPPEYMAELEGNDAYTQLARDAQRLEEVKASQEHAVNEYVNDNMPMIKEAVESSPLYQAEKSITMNLQLFGSKDMKKLAKDYRDNKMSSEQQAEFERIAEENGFSSGDELAQKVGESRTLSEELEYQRGKLREDAQNRYMVSDSEREVIGQMNDGTMKRAAMEGAEIAEEDVNGTRADAIKGIEDEINELEIPEELGMDAPELQRLFQSVYKSSSKSGGQDKTKARIKKEVNEAVAKYKEKIKKVREDYKAKLKAQGQDLRLEAKEALQQGRDEGYQKGYDKAAYNYERKLDSLDKRLDSVKKRLDDYVDLWYGRESRIARTGDFTVGEAKKLARGNIQLMPIKKGTDYKSFFRQAQNARLRSNVYYRKKDFQNALMWKNKEVMAYAMGQEAVRMKETVNKYEGFIGKIGKSGTKSFQREADFVQAASIMKRFGFVMKDGDKYPVTENLQQWTTKATQISPNVDIAEWLYNEQEARPYTELTIDQLKDVRDAIANIRKVSNGIDKMLSSERRESLAQTVSDIVGEVDSYHKKQFAVDELSRDENRFKQRLTGYLNETKEVETAVRLFAGEDSVFYDVWVRRPYQQGNKASKLISEYCNKEKAIWDRYTSKEIDSFATKKIFVESMGVNVTKREMFAMAMNLGTATNREKLFTTRPAIFADAKEYNSGTVMQMLNDNFTAKDWETVQMRWDMLNELWPLISKHERENAGYTPDKVEATPFYVVTDGELKEMKGGYFPLEQDFIATAASAEIAERDTSLYNNARGAVRVATRKGFTKQRTNVHYAVSLDQNIVENHITDVVTDLYFRNLVSDLSNMMANQEFRNMLQTHGGTSMVDTFQDQIRVMANQPYARTSLKTCAAISRWARRAVGNASICLNIGVATQNLANITLYAGAVKGFGVGNTIHGVLRYGVADFWPKAIFNWRGENGVRQRIYAESQFMADRARMPDQTFRELQTGIARGEYDNNLRGRMAKLSQALMLGFDDVMAVPMWLEAKNKALNEGKSYEQAIEYADTLIRRVNGSGRALDHSRIVRASSNEVTSVLTQFYSFFNVELNRWMIETGLAKQRGLAGVPRMAAFLTSRIVVFPLVSNLLAGKLPKEDDDPFAWFAAGALTYPFSLFPVAKDLIPVMINGALGMDTYSYRAGGIVSVINQGYNVFRSVGSINNKLSNGEDLKRGQAQQTVENVSRFATMLMGIPNFAQNVFWNSFDYVYNGMEPEPMDILKRRPAKERPYMSADGGRSRRRVERKRPTVKRPNRPRIQRGDD